MRHVNSSNRVYKFPHENLREIPRGPSGLLEISENYSDDDVTAYTDGLSNLVHETDLNDDDSITDNRSDIFVRK